jgi:hypothetical protein
LGHRLLECLGFDQIHRRHGSPPHEEPILVALQPPPRESPCQRARIEGKIGLKPDEEIAGGLTYKFAGNTACFLYPAAKTVNGIATGGGAKAAWR